MSYFGLLLKTIRIKSGKTQIQMAEDLNVQQTRISYLERLKAAPKDEMIELLANYFSVPISYFYEDSSGNSDDIVMGYLDSLSKEPDSNDKSPYDLVLHAMSGLSEEKMAEFTDMVREFNNSEDNSSTDPDNNG